MPYAPADLQAVNFDPLASSSSLTPSPAVSHSGPASVLQPGTSTLFDGLRTHEPQQNSMPNLANAMPSAGPGVTSMNPNLAAAAACAPPLPQGRFDVFQHQSLPMQSPPFHLQNQQQFLQPMQSPQFQQMHQT